MNSIILKDHILINLIIINFMTTLEITIISLSKHYLINIFNKESNHNINILILIEYLIYVQVMDKIFLSICNLIT